MKVISDKHFNEMQMMSRIFGERSSLQELYLPEYEASKLINEIIQMTDEPKYTHFQKIVSIIEGVESVQHANGAAWLDYKLHVVATLRVNGFLDTKRF
jgi:hypothetical protein